MYWTQTLIQAPFSHAVNTARSPEFRDSLRGMVNPYGEGFASETIVRVLTTIPLSQQLLIKRHSGVPVSVVVVGGSQHS